MARCRAIVFLMTEPSCWRCSERIRQRARNRRGQALACLDRRRHHRRRDSGPDHATQPPLHSDRRLAPPREAKTRSFRRLPGSTPSASKRRASSLRSRAFPSPISGYVPSESQFSFPLLGRRYFSRHHFALIRPEPEEQSTSVEKSALIIRPPSSPWVTTGHFPLALR